MNFAVPIGCFIIILQLMLTCSPCSADRPQDEGGESAVEGTCQSLNILMVHNSSTGVQALFTSTMSMNTSIIDLPNHYLPSECGYNNHRCGILHFEHNRYSYYIIPLIRSFVMLYHSVDYMDPELEMQKVFVNVSEECNPTRAFRVRANHVIIACMDLQSRSKETLYYLNYDLIFPSSTGSSLISRNTELPTKPETIYDPATVSDIIYVPEQTRCEQRDNLYFIDDTYAVRFPVRAFDPQFIPSSNALADCIDYQGFEYYGNDNLIIRCSNSRTALYDSCDTGLFTYPPHDQIPYPCSNWNNVIVYRNGTQLSLNRDGDSVTQQLPFNDISFGRCVQRTDHPVFIASSADGAIFITHFNGNNFTKITSGNCSNINNGACPRPIFSENEHVFGIFDSKTGNFVIVNVTEGCLENPVIAQIPIPIVPPLVSVSLSQRSYNCSCSPMQNNELPSTTQTESTPEATQTESVSESITMQTNDAGQTKFTTTTNPSESTSFPTDSSTSTSHHQPYSNTSSISNEGLLAGVLTVAVVLSLASILILAFLVCKLYCFCHMKEEDFHPNVQFHQETNGAAENQLRDFNTDPGANSTVDQSDGGSHSSESTMTTSVPDSDAVSSTMAIDQPEQIVASQAESGQPGGASCLPSRKTLPLICTQLGADLVHEQYDSRTSDNKDKEDMDDKVHKINRGQ